MTSETTPDFTSFYEMRDLPVVDGRKVVSSALLQKNPCAIQNAFVDLVGMMDYDTLLPEQRFAHLAFQYDSEVQNGGHLQYFTNLVLIVGSAVAEARVKETVQALSHIEAVI